MSLRIVVAEDEALIRLDLCEQLTEAGYEIVGQAGTGEDAVRLVTQLQPDLVLLDIRMPKLDGLSAAEIIARERHTAVVMLTAFSDLELVKRAEDAGAQAYLVKPVSPAQLVPTVQLAWARHQDALGLSQSVTEMQRSLADRKLIEQAKERIAARLAIPEAEAYDLLKKQAMHQRESMATIAKRVLATDL